MQNLSASNFIWVMFSHFFQRIRTQLQILRFIVPISNLKKKFFCLNLNFLLTSLNRTKRLLKRKNIFNKCVLDSHFTYISSLCHKNRCTLPYTASCLAYCIAGGEWSSRCDLYCDGRAVPPALLWPYSTVFPIRSCSAARLWHYQLLL